jgi:hypothetical protein
MRFLAYTTMEQNSTAPDPSGLALAGTLGELRRGTPALYARHRRGLPV